MARGKPMSAERVNRIRELHAQGRTYKQIATAVGCSHVTVYKAISGKLSGRATATAPTNAALPVGNANSNTTMSDIRTVAGSNLPEALKLAFIKDITTRSMSSGQKGTNG